MNAPEVRPALLLDLVWIKPMADRHRAEVGFVRRATLAAAVGRGELLVARDQQGFLHYHRRRDGWHTVYELVSEGGVGRALLDAVPRPRRLRCPAGVPANGFYAHVGGRLAGTEPGRARRLNVWEWSA